MHPRPCAHQRKAQQTALAARGDLEKAQREGDLAAAGELSYGVIPDLEQKIAAAESEQDSIEFAYRLVDFVPGQYATE